MSRLSCREEDYLIIQSRYVGLSTAVHSHQVKHEKVPLGQHLPGNGGWGRAEHAAAHNDVHSLYHWILLRVHGQYPRSHVWGDRGAIHPLTCGHP